MHFYQFHIGDYASHTRHLSLIEDLAYRRLLDHYYLHEEPIKKAIISRLIGMREHEQEVGTILDEFFVDGEHGYINPRADDEIAKYRKFSEDGKRGAAKRWHKDGNGDTISPPIATPIATNNQQPTTNNHKPKNTATSVATPEGVSDSVWKDFKSLRKAKRAPLTQRAIDSIKAEANQAGWPLEKALSECCVRGWQAFKSEWVLPKVQADVVRMTVPSRNTPDPTLERLKAEDAFIRPPNIAELQKLAELRKRM